jgi:hypothetical protein
MDSRTYDSHGTLLVGPRAAAFVMSARDVGMPMVELSRSGRF